MIRFDETDWQRTEATYQAFWNHELERPLLPLQMHGLDPQREAPRVRPQHFLPQYGQEVSAEEIVDVWDHELSGLGFLGDAFPTRWVNFGAGCLAMPLGCRAGVDEHTVWFHPDRHYEVDELEPVYDPEHPWLQRIAAVMRAAGERWGDRVQVGMTDIGGVYDVVQSFLPGEELLLALYDDPDEVKRVAATVEAAWWRMFEQLDPILRSGGNRGWSAWAGIFCNQPGYMFQSDFCYMISPEMFGEFIMPELSRSFAKVPMACYHLDGIGELPHLDQLLADPNLKLIQWVPGDGQPGAHEWVEVYRRILEAGKLAQIITVNSAKESAWEQIERLIDALGSGKGLVAMTTGCGRERQDEACAWLERLGVPVGTAQV